MSHLVRHHARRYAAVALIRCALCVFGLAATAAPAESLIDINTADAATLAAGLPGIGPVKAAAIVEHRVRHGGFVSVDRLVEVPGIGTKTLAAIRSLVTAGPWVEGTRDTPRRPARARVAERAAVRAVGAVIALAERDAARGAARVAAPVPARTASEVTRH